MTRAPRARMGRPPVLTREAVARAVLDVGFAELTFAAVRDCLRVGQTTLYRYAPDRDELVRVALDYAIAQVEWPSLEGPWREVLERYAITAWNTWAAYPGAATEATRGILPAGMMRLLDDIAAMLMRQGFTPDNAVLACEVVFDLVTDNRRSVEHLDAVVPGAGPGRAHLHELWSEDASPSPPHGTATPTERDRIHATMRAAISARPLDWFTGKLQVVLDGVEQRLAPH